MYNRWNSKKYAKTLRGTVINNNPITSGSVKPPIFNNSKNPLMFTNSSKKAKKTLKIKNANSLFFVFFLLAPNLTKPMRGIVINFLPKIKNSTAIELQQITIIILPNSAGKPKASPKGAIANPINNKPR